MLYLSNLGQELETHGQNHPKSETEGTSGPTKWTLVQQKVLKKTWARNFQLYVTHSYEHCLGFESDHLTSLFNL